MNSQINGIRFSICGVVQSTILANNSTVFNSKNFRIELYSVSTFCFELFYTFENS